MARRAAAQDIDALLQALPPALAALARRGVPHPYRKGAVLIEEGASGDTLYVILAGRLRAFSTNLAQDREITYGSYGPGEYVGEMGLDGGRRSATVIAEAASICAVIARPTLETHIAENPGFAFELLAKVIARARAATLTARQLALNDVYGRLKWVLESAATPPGADGWCRIERLTHRELAAQLGCSREMVSRVMKDLERGGHVLTEAQVIRVRLPLPPRW
ncbi:MAG: Crp/Fnr family transcriptional regulator [Rubrivivax sp.]|nr:Crp/Fnr family transcriptional regulator [Rubrivivax sp.]